MVGGGKHPPPSAAPGGKSPVLLGLRYSPRAQRLAIWNKFSFSLRIVPYINHFSYPLTIVQINIFEEPQNIFSQSKSQISDYRARLPVFLTIECPPPGFIELFPNLTFLSMEQVKNYLVQPPS